jgi:glycerol-3-phosphate acyltransferase PlsY
MSVGSLAAALAYPFLVWRFAPEYRYFAIAAAVFLILTHADNIKRIVRGEEKTLTIGHADKGKE